MNFLRTLLIPVLAILLSCQPEDTTPATGTPPPLVQTNVVRGHVDGILKEAGEDASCFVEDNVFHIWGSNGMSFGWALSLPKGTVPGQTVLIDEEDPEAGIYFADGITGLEYLSITGSVTLTLKDTISQKISGTFQGVLYNDEGNINVTNGYFSVSYSE